MANYPTSEHAVESLFWKAQSLEKQGESAGASARDAYLQYVTKYPNQPWVLDAALGAGRAALVGKQYASSRIDLQKALKLCADSGQGANTALAERAKNVAPEAQYYLAQTYFEEKNYDEAVKHFAAVSVYIYEPWYSRSLLQMAQCSAITGDRLAAQRTLQLLLNNFPTSEAAQQIPQMVKEYNLELAAEP